MKKNYAVFTKKMRQTHTILLPEMLEYHFGLLKAAFDCSGYHMEILSNKGESVKECGLKYANNDICYPAILITGQLIDALNKGLYDPDKVAFMIPQASGACRATNYFYLIKKALKEAGYPQIPVISLNLGGKEKQPGFSISIQLILRAVTAVCYGDLLMSLYLQIHPYEVSPGETKAKFLFWEKYLSLDLGRHFLGVHRKKMYVRILDDFSRIPIKRKPLKKVGIVGELYIKFCILGNHGIEEFLDGQNCDYHMLGFTNYCIYVYDSALDDMRSKGRSKTYINTAELVYKYIKVCQRGIIKAMKSYTYMPVPEYEAIRENSKDIIGHGCQTGDGWLVSAECAELIENGYVTILCIHPFGCLVSHVCERGIIEPLQKKYRFASIHSIEYDSGLTDVSRINRILLTLQDD